MPDSNSTTDLMSEITLLKNALEREKQLNAKLQNKLESASNETFTRNKELIEGYEKATSRQVQLQLLARIAQGFVNTSSVDDLATSFLAKITDILNLAHGYYIKLNNTGQPHSFQITDKEQMSELPNTAFTNLLAKVAQTLSPLGCERQWNRADISTISELTESQDLLHENQVLYTMLSISAHESIVFLLFIEHFCYSDEFKQTLDTACDNFAIAYTQKLADQARERNYLKLQTVLKKLKTTQSQLIHSEKMASLGQLAAGVAHEINNPLSFVNSNLSVLSEYIEELNTTLSNVVNAIDDKKQKDNLSFILTDSNDIIQSCLEGVIRISDIVSSLKAFSRKDANEYSNVSISDVVNDSLKMVENKLKYGVTVDTSQLNSESLIIGNSGQLQQIFVNLFINAIHAMDNEGTLTITADNYEGEVVVVVSDTGKGMTQETMKRIFEPFFTTKRQDVGTGLGLSVSYAIIESHNGEISVESEIDKGTKFRMRFPAA